MDINIGQQKIAFRYKFSATGAEFSSAFRDIIPPGIYEGGDLSIVNTNQIQIAPFKIAINSNSDKKIVLVETQLNINMFTDVGLSITESKPYAVISYTWTADEDNGLTFSFKAVEEIETNDIVLGFGVFTGSVLTDVSTAEKSTILHPDAFGKYLLEIEDFNSHYAFSVPNGTVQAKNIKASNTVDAPTANMTTVNATNVNASNTNTTNVNATNVHGGVDIYEWQLGKSYKLNQVVQYNLGIYSCIKEHTSTVSINPNLATYWSSIGGKSVKKWKAQDTIFKGDTFWYEQSLFPNNTLATPKIPALYTYEAENPFHTTDFEYDRLNFKRLSEIHQPSGEINYFPQGDFEDGVSSVSMQAYRDGATASIPVTGSGNFGLMGLSGSPTKSTKLFGNYCGVIQKLIADAWGSGIAFPWIGITEFHTNKTLQVKFKYLIEDPDDAYNDGDFSVFLQDMTSGAIIEVSSEKLYKGAHTFSTTFMTTSSKVYRILIHHTTNNYNQNYKLYIDNVFFGESEDAVSPTFSIIEEIVNILDAQQMTDAEKTAAGYLTTDEVYYDGYPNLQKGGLHAAGTVFTSWGGYSWSQYESGIMYIEGYSLENQLNPLTMTLNPPFTGGYTVTGNILSTDAGDAVYCVYFTGSHGTLTATRTFHLSDTSKGKTGKQFNFMMKGRWK